MCFENGGHVLRNAAAATVAYVFLVVVLRISGKRTLAKLNAFDLVVTIALGSTLATLALSSEVALADGFASLGALVLLQYVVAWLVARAAVVRRSVTSEPTLVLTDGRLLDDVITRQQCGSGNALPLHTGSGDG